MFNNFIKDQSILKKFLYINFVIFIVIGSFTIFYLKDVQPTLMKGKTIKHIQVINNTIDHVKRLKIEFNKEDIRKFLFSTRFLFQNLDRVIIFDNNFNMIGDTDTLDLDPRSFSQSLEVVETDILSESTQKVEKEKNIKKDKEISLNEILKNYSKSKEYGKPHSFTQESYNQFLLVTIKNVHLKDNNIGYLAITENANDIKSAINERKTFIIRTAVIVAIVIFIFSFVLNRYFLKPIKSLVAYTKIIKEKSKQELNIEKIKSRNDELGILSNSLQEMTKELHKRINIAENYSRDLVHEIRNPLASLKSASEIISETDNKEQKNRLLKILSHDVERIERLITDYSQMLKDEATITTEKMKKIDLKEIVSSVVDDFNNIYHSKRGIDIKLKTNGKKNYIVLGIENRIEQILANLLENSVSFSKDNKKINVELNFNQSGSIVLGVIDEGEGFKEKDIKKIFDRFYSNRPGKFGEHSGLGLNIVKNLVELHDASITATNNKGQNGAKVEIIFPKI